MLSGAGALFASTVLQSGTAGASILAKEGFSIFYLDNRGIWTNLSFLGIRTLNAYSGY